MRIIRLFGNIALWIAALLGIAAGAVWVGGKLGVVQPLIVISGSMEPQIMTGDLLIDRPIPTDTVEVGDILSLQSELTGKLVTHRVVSIERSADSWEIRLRGDANSEDDLEPYTVGDEVLTPFVQIPMAGKVVSKLMEPSVAIPVLVALVALLGVSLLDDEPRRRIRRTIDRTIDRVGRRSPELDALDRDLAKAGVDIAQFADMHDLDDLDLALFAAGVDVRSLPVKTAESTPRGEVATLDDGHGGDKADDHTREPALSG